MANSRIINTHFWKDSYIIDLNPDEKLLFIYFITNPRTTLAGIYEISLREVQFDTALPTETIQHALHKFQQAGKMYYERNWLILSNFIKHQRLNPSMIRGIEKALEELPDWIQSIVSLEQSGSYPQLTIFNGGDEQTDNSLPPPSPQLKEIKLNIKKLKEKKLNQSEPDKPEDSGGLSKSQKRSYAIAMENEREQERRAAAASNRAPGTVERLQNRIKGMQGGTA